MADEPVMEITSDRYKLMVRRGDGSSTSVKVNRVLPLQGKISVFVSEEQPGLNLANFSAGYQDVMVSENDRESMNELVAQIAQRRRHYYDADENIKKLQQLWGTYV